MRMRSYFRRINGKMGKYILKGRKTYLKSSDSFTKAIGGHCMFLSKKNYINRYLRCEN